LFERCVAFGAAAGKLRGQHPGNDRFGKQRIRALRVSTHPAFQLRSRLIGR
jgi:hypothetical protein